MIMKEQNNDRLRNKQREQQANDPNKKDNTASAQKGMNREAEDELLTTSGPVDRSSIEEADRGAIAAHTGGMSMKDEEANPSKDDFVQGPRNKKGRSARYGHPETGTQPVSPIENEDEDTSQDKTEGIVNPRTTLEDWAKFKGAPGKSSGQENKEIKGRGKSNNNDIGREFKDIAPV